MSADDGIRNLYLDFGGPEGELVREFLRNMFILIGILFLSFLSLLTSCMENYGLIFHFWQVTVLQVSRCIGFFFPFPHIRLFLF